jgi:hypothetical protein
MSKKVTVQMRLPDVMTVGVEKYGLSEFYYFSKEKCRSHGLSSWSRPHNSYRNDRNI